MRRISFIFTVALVCLAGATFAPGAIAGNFDEGKMGCVGDNPATCPPGTVGQPFSMTIYLSPPDDGRGEDFDCATFHVTSGALPPGLSISDEGIISGTPTTAGSYDLYLTVKYDKTPICAKTPSDDRFIFNINPQVLRLFVATTSLPDANLGQAYTSPALTAERHRQLLDPRRRHVATRVEPRHERRHHRHADTERTSRSPSRRTARRTTTRSSSRCSSSPRSTSASPPRARRSRRNPSP